MDYFFGFLPTHRLSCLEKFIFTTVNTLCQSIILEPSLRGIGRDTVNDLLLLLLANVLSDVNTHLSTLK